ncbi:MAG: RNA polymerase sigma factor [Sandaracinaceae bacterium]
MSRPLDASASEEDPDDVADLVRRVCEGERSALAEVYDRHHRPLRTLGRRLLGAPEAAEDLVQDVFVNLPSSLRRFEGRASLRSFLVAVTCNRSRHFVRAAARYRRAKERFAEQARATAETPDASYARREMADRLSRALDTLVHEQRVTFVLRVIEGRNTAEVARLTGVPEATVRTRTMRARTKLEASLEGGRR